MKTNGEEKGTVLGIEEMYHKTAKGLASDPINEAVLHQIFSQTKEQKSKTRSLSLFHMSFSYVQRQ